MCWAAPVVTVLRGDEAPRVIPRVTADQAAALLDAVTAGAPREHADVAAFLAGQRRELMSRCGITDPGDIADAIRRGSYEAFRRVLGEAQPERVIETVKRAGLRGRGGAYFQAALKWEGARRAAGPIKYLIVNGEEGEPGIFKDRHLLEGDPHRLLEGALLAAYAAGASRMILYIHGEAHLAARHVERALAQARRGGLRGRARARQRLLGRGRDPARRGRVRAGRGDGADGVARGPARDAAAEAAVPDRVGRLRPAHRHQQCRDPLRRPA